MAIEWLEWEARQRDIQIRHEYNNTEKRIGSRRLPVDDFHAESQTVFQFHGSLILHFILLGCYWHGHDCHLNEGKEECKWREMKKTNKDLQRFIATRLHRPLDKVQTMTTQSIINAVKGETLLGCVECDIRVPEHLRDHFQEMCPIFKNVEISGEDIGDYMKTYAEENDVMKQPRHSLIGSMIGEKILLATPLLRWYLEHGLEVTHIYQVIEYSPKMGKPSQTKSDIAKSSIAMMRKYPA
ncbi:Hypothetical predicted protein [Paramuricea clavata]|uniref:Uncharacterized protein n=1 Tax=Paramuricea clavata TaxID=317549 RepID=A0A6S7HE87_PARCT|nr:Hypothetical predicted protein [Paramuricea clavata]